MDYTDISKRLEAHRAYWDGTEMQIPIVATRMGSILFNEQFKASAYLFKQGKRITPDMLDVDSFLEDYERMYQETLNAGQTAFWAAEPFNAVPWLEAILGCQIYGTESSLVSAHVHDPFTAIDKYYERDPWVEKYIEFLSKLVQLSNNRFPVGQSLLRGPSDVAGALFGQKEFIYALYDEPEKTTELLSKITSLFLYIIKKIYEVVPDYHGGYTIGFFHLWAPGKCIWYQEDLTALLSPKLFNNYIKEQDEKLCNACQYSLMHLHPSSFAIVDDILNIKSLKALEVNKDTGGPSIREMLPILQKIIEKKKLLIWGELDIEDVDLIYGELPQKGIMLHIVTKDIAHASNLMEYTYKKHREMIL